MEKPAPDPTPPPTAREDVRVAANRCPYCRDDVEPAGSAVCEACLTRHHPACWDEAGACSSCQATTRLAVQRPPLSDALITAALGERGYPASEVQAYLTQDRPITTTCGRSTCNLPGGWVSGQSAQPLCQEHATRARREALQISVVFCVLFSVGTLAVLGTLVVDQDLDLFPLPVLLGAAAVAFGLLARAVHRRPIERRAPDSEDASP